MHPYAPLEFAVTTPLIELRGATDDLLDGLLPLVRAGQADADPPPFDDPISLYEADPDTRVHKWLQAIWRGRARVASDFWRVNLVVLVDGRAVGMQDVIGAGFETYGTVTTFSWLAADFRGRGIGREMREAALHLCFDGFDAVEAASDAFVDNIGSNRVSEDARIRAQRHELGYSAWEARASPALAHHQTTMAASTARRHRRERCRGLPKDLPGNSLIANRRGSVRHRGGSPRAVVGDATGSA